MTPRLFVRMMMLRGSGWVRPLLVTITTTTVSAVVLVAVAVVQLPSRPPEQASNLLTDPGVRPGYVFALLLICAGPLGLLYQAIRLGSSARERRMAALRLAGATPQEVRTTGAFEVGIPALVGGALGWAGYVFLRSVAGGDLEGRLAESSRSSLEMRVVPVSVAPSFPQILAVVVLVGVVGALIGARAVGRSVTDPLGETRQVTRRPPRPWSLLLLGPAVVIAYLVYVANTFHGATSTALGIVMIGCLLVAFIGLGSSVAYLAGRVAVRHSRSAVGLLAGTRLVTDPRATGRAAATVGGVSLAAGVSSWFFLDVEQSGNHGDWIYLGPLALEVAMLVFTLFLVAMSLAIHGAETAMGRKRAFAALVAQGSTGADLVRAHRSEIAVVVLPLSALGVVLGSVPTVLLGGSSTLSLILTPLTIVATLLSTWLAVLIASAMARPAIQRACALESLRTP